MRKKQFLKAGTAGALLILTFVVFSASDIVPELIFKDNSVKSEEVVSAEELNKVTRNLKNGIIDSIAIGDTDRNVADVKRSPVMTDDVSAAQEEQSGEVSEIFEIEDMSVGLLASSDLAEAAPSANALTLGEPAADNPTVDDPTVDDPIVGDPSIEEPSVDDPSVAENIYVRYPALDQPYGGQTFLTAGNSIENLSAEIEIPEGLSEEEEKAYLASIPYRVKMGEILPYFVENEQRIITLDENDEEQELSSDSVEFLSIYYQGTQDPSVAYIQQHLMDLGFMESAEPTEYYGSITMAAVKLFQRQNGLKQDGIMGQESLGMLINPDAQRYLLKPEMEGEDIQRVQTRLYELGYLSSRDLITGYYGSQTEAAVKAMQAANELDADGKIGEMTFELLYSGDVKANVLSFGDKSDIVLECQERLKELGYLTTKPDGLYGNDTLAAVKLFQSRNDLVVDGYLGPTTREVLLSSAANTNGLMLGSEGDTVKRVQELLIKYGYLGSGKNTGYFGTQTDAAVKAFQRDNGLVADGEVGAKTMAKLTGGTASGSGSSSSSGYKISDDSSVEDSINALIKVAKSKLGCSYVWGGKGPNTFDCSGFVYWCLNQIGVKQSYITSNGWRTVGKYKKITDYSSLKKGDIIVVSGHVGIIAEDRTVIDASSSKGKIMHRKLSSWWSDRFICGWRIFY